MKKIVVVLCILISWCKVVAQTWHDVGGGVSAAEFLQNFGVRAMVNDSVHHYLYVSGQFDSAGHIQSKNLARWDGSMWSTIGNYNAEAIFALCMYNNSLVMGFNNGNILFVDSAGNALHLFKSDGTIEAITVYNGDLYVGGLFDEVNGVSASAIARYNGVKWMAVNGGMDWCCGPLVQALYVWNSKLYAGGAFSQAGDSLANNIAVWNDTTWAPLGSGTNDSNTVNSGYVYSMGSYNNDLYVGGQFLYAGGKTAKSIAKWDGANWFAVGDGTNGHVYSLMTFKKELYIGGIFDTAGSVGTKPPGGIVKWNDTLFSSIDSGVRGDVVVIDTFKKELYTGGVFDTAGSVIVSNIAVLYIDSTTTNVKENSINLNQVSISPNPFSIETLIRFTQPTNSTSKLTLFDLTGSEVENYIIPKDSKNLIIKKSNLVAGMYFYKIVINQKLITGKICVD